MKSTRRQRREERGSTLLLAAFALVILLAMGALAIDVATLYVARTEAQRVADAAALAGANAFAASGCTNAGTCDTLQPQAKIQAKAVGDANDVFSQAANIADADVTFPSSGDANDPLVQVVVRRSVPTFLAGALQRFLGGASSSSNVVAKATAEAFNPSSSNAQFSAACLKPWVFPNWDPTTGNPLVNSDGTIVNPAAVNGAEVLWHRTSTTPQYLKVNLSGGGGGYQSDIGTCNPVQLKSGDTLSVLPGARGTQTAINNLINGPTGQDTIAGPPFSITPGANNPFVLNSLVSPGSTVTTSPSIVSVPLYNPPCIGSCSVVGFMQIFIVRVGPDPNPASPCHSAASSDICGTILNIVALNSDPGSTPVVGGGAGLLPVRLISP